MEEEKRQSNYVAFIHGVNERPVYVMCDQIFSVFRDGTNKLTHLLGPGGAIIPVKETPDEVMKMIKAKELLKDEPNQNQKS